MIDKYLLEDLSLRSDEKGELARWVIQLQADVDTERRKSASLESVIYARDTRIAELECQLQSGFTPEALAQEERAENAEQRVAELEAKTAMTMGVGSGNGNLFVHGDYDSIKAAQAIVLENESLRAKLATPVRLPKPCAFNLCDLVDRDAVIASLREQGFTVSEE